MIKNTLLATIFLSLLPFSITIVSKPALANCPAGQVRGFLGICRRQIYCPDGVPTGTNGCILKPSPNDAWGSSKSTISRPWDAGNDTITVRNNCDVPLVLALKTLRSNANQWEDEVLSLSPSAGYQCRHKQNLPYYLYANSSKGTWTGSDTTTYINGQALGMMQKSGDTNLTCN